MTHQQRHRGAHPDDVLLFADSQLPKLRNALHDDCRLRTPATIQVTSPQPPDKLFVAAQ